MPENILLVSFFDSHNYEGEMDLVEVMVLLPRASLEMVIETIDLLILKTQFVTFVSIVTKKPNDWGQFKAWREDLYPKALPHSKNEKNRKTYSSFFSQKCSFLKILL